MLQSVSLGARQNSRKVIFLLTDGQVTDQFMRNYLPVIRRLNNTDILRIGNLFIFCYKNRSKLSLRKYYFLLDPRKSGDGQN